MNPEKYLLLASVGLLVLALSGQMDPNQIKIGEIRNQDIGEKVRVSGEVSNFQRVPPNNFFNLSDGSGDIQVAMFSSEKAFSDGEKITLTGRVTLYHGKLELIAESASRRSTS